MMAAGCAVACSPKREPRNGFSHCGDARARGEDASATAEQTEPWRFNSPAARENSSLGSVAFSRSNSGEYPMYGSRRGAMVGDGAMRIPRACEVHWESLMFRRSCVKFIAVLAAAAAFGATAPAALPATDSPGHAVAAATCRWGKIDGQRKHLCVGQFCKHSLDRQYRHYGFRCIKYYRNVQRYRLTKA